MKAATIKVLSMIILIISLLFLWKQNQTLKATKERLEDNQSILMNYKDSVQVYKTSEGLYVATIKELNITKQELSELNFKNKDLINDLDIKLKRLLQVNSTLMESRYDISTVVRDTVIKIDSVLTPMKAIDYKSKWVDISGVIGVKAELIILTREELVYLEYIEPRNIWFIKYGHKRVRQEITSKNPNTVITSTEFIQVTK